MCNYIQSFWAIDLGRGDIGPNKRAQIAKAALALNQNPNVLLSTSAGGYTDAELPEIALVVDANFDPKVLERSVAEALAAEQINVKPELKDDVRYLDFGKTQIDNITHATNVSDLQSARQAIDELAGTPLYSLSEDAALPDVAAILRSIAETLGTPDDAAAHRVAESIAAAPLQAGSGVGDIPNASDVLRKILADIPPSQISESFSVSAQRFLMLKDAKGNAIKENIEGLSKAFSSLKNETNTNAATATMVASGLVTIGSAMWKLYSAVQAAGSITALVSQLLAAVGGIAALGAIILGIAVVFGLLWVLLKE